MEGCTHTPDRHFRKITSAMITESTRSYDRKCVEFRQNTVTAISCLLKYATVAVCEQGLGRTTSCVILLKPCSHIHNRVESKQKHSKDLNCSELALTGKGSSIEPDGVGKVKTPLFQTHFQEKIIIIESIQ